MKILPQKLFLNFTPNVFRPIKSKLYLENNLALRFNPVFIVQSRCHSCITLSITIIRTATSDDVLQVIYFRKCDSYSKPDEKNVYTRTRQRTLNAPGGFIRIICVRDEKSTYDDSRAESLVWLSRKQNIMTRHQ